MKRREPKSITVYIRYKGGATQTIPLPTRDLHSLTIDKEYDEGPPSSRPVYPTPDYEPRPTPEPPSPWKR